VAPKRPITSRQQGVETTARVKRREIVEAADMTIADENLRHGAAAGNFDHRVALRRIKVDADLFDLGYALIAE